MGWSTSGATGVMVGAQAGWKQQLRNMLHCCLHASTTHIDCYVHREEQNTLEIIKSRQNEPQ